MSRLFTFDWQRDPNGYEIRTADYGERVIAPKTRKQETYRPLELGVQKRALFQILADTPLTPEGYLGFANNFGLLVKDTEQQFATWEVEIKGMRLAADALERRDFAELIWIFNPKSTAQVSVILEPGANPGERPALRVRPVDLSNALWLQLAEAAAADFRIQHCHFPGCRTPFAYGPGTRRRSAALYCSAKCQKAHAYQKRKEARK